jgi:hypothetical protein
MLADLGYAELELALLSPIGPVLGEAIRVNRHAHPAGDQPVARMPSPAAALGTRPAGGLGIRIPVRSTLTTLIAATAGVVPGSPSTPSTLPNEVRR